jgi:DNA-binding response OmpR family regulator
VLCVEDEGDLRLVTGRYLAARGYDVLEADGSATARRRLAGGTVDVVILDLGLPDGDGLDLLREVRRDGDVGVIIVTGRAEEPDRVLGLELGADDYLVKPFSQRELVARIGALLRRRGGPPRAGNVLRFGPLAIDTAAREVTVDTRGVTLARREYELLAFLAGHPGRTYTHEQLLAQVWGSSREWQSTRTLSEHVYRLRRKLALDGSGPRIATVRGVGYRFDP